MPLKILAHPTKGCNRKTLLPLYQSFIRSVIDYGSPVYGLTPPSQLNLLKPAQNSALRIATGAFRTSPAISLYTETGIPPLKSRRMSQPTSCSQWRQTHPCPSTISCSKLYPTAPTPPTYDTASIEPWPGPSATNASPKSFLKHQRSSSPSPKLTWNSLSQPSQQPLPHSIGHSSPKSLTPTMIQ